MTIELNWIMISSNVPKTSIKTVAQRLTLRYSSKLSSVKAISFPPFFSSIFGYPGRTKSRSKSSIEQPSIARLSMARRIDSAVYNVVSISSCSPRFKVVNSLDSQIWIEHCLQKVTGGRLWLSRWQMDRHVQAGHSLRWLYFAHCFYTLQICYKPN